MSFEEILDQAIAMLQRRGRVTYRAVKLQFHLDDEHLEALKEELIEAERLAIDENGRMLVWIGKPGITPEPILVPSQPVQSSNPELDQSAWIASLPIEHSTPDAERRQLTVMFCDLADSTTLAGQLDPEDFRDVVRAYQATCAAVIQRFDGYIAQYLGDGLLVYFGYPQAHEDDAQRAVRASLGIVEALGELNGHLEQHNSSRLAVRVGLHTGLVVVGEMGGEGRQEQLALGETPNIAARIQGLAAPDTVVISAATYRLIQGYFVCQGLGMQTLKGVAQPTMVYQVLRDTGAQSHLEVAVARGLTPLVGREQEVALLVERWDQVKDGQGQVVLLSGEAGIGKSRLVQVMKDHVAGEPHTRWECRCSPYYQNSALYPVIDMLRRALQGQRDEALETTLERLESAIAPYVSLPDVVPLFASLLSLPLPDRYSPLTLSPQQHKQKTLEALLGLLLALAARQPVLCIIEDLHWLDPSTLELLSLCVDQAPTSRILLVLTFRPDFRVPWSARAHLAPITLSRLLQGQVEVMVERVAGGKSLPVEVRQHLIANTDGVPLFVEELTKMVLESGLLQEREDHFELTGPLPPLAIPATLHDSLMARLDRLAAVKGVAQVGATLGREFSYEVLQAVSSLDETTLQEGLAQLMHAEILYQRGLPPQAQYFFKHALIQEAAYQSLLRSTRQQYHRKIAQVLEEHFPETRESQPEMVAHHYTEAGFSAQAITYWQRAGQNAMMRSAHVEALAHLRKGLALTAALPNTPDRLQHELSLHMALGVALTATQGYAAPGVEHAYLRARECCLQVGELSQLFTVLRGLWLVYLVRGKLRMAYEQGKHLLLLAESHHESVLLLEAHRALGASLFFLGDLATAWTHLEQGIALYAPEQHQTLTLRYGLDPGVACLVYSAWILWLRGYPDQALDRIDAALTLVHECQHPFCLAFVLTFAVMLYQCRREIRAVSTQVEACLTVAYQHAFPLFVAMGTVFQGWVLAGQRQGDEGIEEMRQGIAAYRATGAELIRPYFLGLLIEAYGQKDYPAKGLEALDEALSLVDMTEERLYEAEIYRLKGQLLLALPGDNHAQAEACFHDALTIARHQQAKSLELRTAMSLSRLWQQQGKHTEARQMLATIYGWFTEGFDCVDLQEAKALLEVLA